MFSIILRYEVGHITTKTPPSFTLMRSNDRSKLLSQEPFANLGMLRINA